MRVHKYKKRLKVEPTKKELKRCQLRSNTLQDPDGFTYAPGTNFYCEEKYDKKGHPYMRVYRTEDAESFWPFSVTDFYQIFIILR